MISGLEGDFASTILYIRKTRIEARYTFSIIERTKKKKEKKKERKNRKVRLFSTRGRVFRVANEDED